MKQKELLIVVAVVAVVILASRKREEPAQASGSFGLWGGLAKGIGDAVEKANDSLGRVIDTVYENKRAQKAEDYARMRDAKDNSALFSNDMLLY